jgi:uncharacterized protein YggL (DUF469 family)
MIRLHVTAEGQTEQAFVKKVLAPHLAKSSVFADARCVLTSKDKRTAKEYRGGLLHYQKVKNDILTWLKEDSNTECRFTTMFDLYVLPNDFPAFKEAMHQSDPYKRCEILEDALYQDIGDRRFIPYIQLHEFEALIFADLQKLDWEYLEHDELIKNLMQMVGEQNPELINDGWETAPSKRIIKEIPEYDKVSSGVLVTGKIGLPVLRQRCQHFHEWLICLEKLGETT